MCKKDNPVPSLDTLRKEYYKKYGRDDEGTIEHFVEFCETELQNGVETDKEQPKYLVMHCNYPIAFCSDKKKFLKEEMPDDEERELTEFIPVKLGNIDD